MPKTKAATNTSPTMNALQSVPCHEAIAEFTRIASEYRSRLLLAARRFAPTGVDAEDVVQDALLKAYKSLAQFRDESQMKTWLYKITENSARDYWRRKKGRNDVSLEQAWNQGDSTLVLDPQDPARSPEEILLFKEMCSILIDEIENLSFGRRQVFKLCIFEELPQRIVAKRLSIQVVTVKARIFNARRGLKDSIQRRAREGRGRKRTRAISQVKCVGS